jgi:hypothetical protein
VVSNCRQAADQIWIPEQWETQGSRFTHLVNDQYQTKCLNAARPVRNGRVVQLWDCYPAQEELWDFGDWHRAVGAGGVSYPLLAWSSPQCLDADKYDFREGTRVHVWTQYATRNQFWS